METIRIEGLTKKFGELTAVDHLNLSVYAGEVFGLVGPDGAGKTTTMRLLAAILPPSSGEAWVAGHHIVREAGAISDDIGYMAQRFGLYPDLTVAENIAFYADIYGVPRRGRAEKVDQLLGFSNLLPFKKRVAGNLSGGMKQKLGLACALIHTPKVLFLDEPTNGVDPLSRRDFWRIIYRLLRDNVTIFVSTAYLDEAERCSRVGLIHRGRLLAVGTPEEVKRLSHGSILEIRCSEPRRGTSVLREQMPSASVGMFGDRVHVVATDAELARRQIEAAFSAARVTIENIRIIEPTLEDVFVSVLSRPEGESPALGSSGITTPSTGGV